MDSSPVNRIFAFDIGTRTVVGVLAEGSLKGDILNIIDVEIMEHSDRNMFDGQIHDIDQVARIVAQVKERLESRNGCSLTHVSIAAAGRALITHKAKAEVNAAGKGAVDRNFVIGLELKAMQKSQQEIQGLYKDHSQYYCIGYSVVNYYLDGILIKNLDGQRGSVMGVEVISTFLPKTVVDSLYTVMTKANLEVINLTLEPIAAIQIAIPENLRLLNLAMVDIGAGTSDIAITREGTITAYSMVFTAGDEVSEGIAQNYLTDFYTAERMKLEMSQGQERITYKDVMGNLVEVDREELLALVSPVVESMAAEIAGCILKYNQGPPRAVFCIGGGSLIPGLKESLSKQLGIPVTRIGIKNLEETGELKISAAGFSGPEAVTPAGIALMGFKSSGDHFINVTVNGKSLKMLNTREMTVADALLGIGFNPKKLIPAIGQSLRFYINGVAREVKGEPGQPAKIKLKGKVVGLDKVLQNGDVIEVHEATEGRRAEITVGEVMQAYACRVFLAGKELMLPMRWSLNGYKVSTGQTINEGDRLEFARIITLGELIDVYRLPKKDNVYRVNGEWVDFEYVLKDGDRIEYQTAEDKAVLVMVNGKEVKLPYKKEPYMFVDIFNYIDFDLRSAKGRVDLVINGTKAKYTDNIKNGDSIQISWSKV